jgi:hypothetical protein
MEKTTQFKFHLGIAEKAPSPRKFLRNYTSGILLLFFFAKLCVNSERALLDCHSRDMSDGGIKSSARWRLRRFPQLKNSLLLGFQFGVFALGARAFKYYTKRSTFWCRCIQIFHLAACGRVACWINAARERERKAHHNLSALSHACFYIIPAFFPDSQSSPLFIRLHGAVPRINYVEQQCLSSEEKTRERKKKIHI